MAATATAATTISTLLKSDQTSKIPTLAKAGEYPEILFCPNPYTVIVGMGIGGLLAAKKLLETGHNVILIENRAEFTREQRVVLSRNVFRTLFELSSLPANGAVLNSTGSITSLNVPSTLSQTELEQDVFYQTILPVTTAKDLPSIRDLQICLNASLMKFASSNARAQLRIFRGPQFEVTKIDGDKQTLTLRDNAENAIHEIDFHYLIAADGAKHSMADLLSQNPKYAIRYEDLPKVRHETCASIAFKLKEGVKLPDNTPKRIITHLSDKTALKPEHLGLLKKLDWEEAYLPTSYIARDSQNIFYMIAEVPSSMGVEDKKAREEWAKTILAIEFAAFGVSAEDFVYYPENNNKINKINPTFKLRLKAAHQNVIALGKKGGFFLIGDARQNPNFFYGHGIEDALSDAEVLYQCFEEASHTLTARDQKDKAESLALDLKAVLDHNQMLKDHYCALHQAMSAILKAKQLADSAKNKSDLIKSASEVLENVQINKARRLVEKRQAQHNKMRDWFLKVKSHEKTVSIEKLKFDLNLVEKKINSEIKQPAPEDVQIAYKALLNKYNAIQKKWIEIQSHQQKSSILDDSAETTEKHLKDFNDFSQEILNLSQAIKKLDENVQDLVEKYNAEVRERVKGWLKILKEAIEIAKQTPPPPPLPLPPDLDDGEISHPTNSNTAVALATPPAAPMLPATELAAKRRADAVQSKESLLAPETAAAAIAATVFSHHSK